MTVRFDLDKSGVKLRLNEWSKLGKADRARLMNEPCDTPEEVSAYRGFLSALVARTSGNPPSLLPAPVDELWLSPTVPAQVREKAASESISLGDEAWADLSGLQRFVLVKLSRPGHENLNFRPAALEFGLTTI